MGAAGHERETESQNGHVRRDAGRGVARCLSEGAPGGGFILAAGDMLPTVTSREKVELMLETSNTWSYWPDSEER